MFSDDQNSFATHLPNSPDFYVYHYCQETIINIYMMGGGKWQVLATGMKLCGGKPNSHF